MRGVRPQEADMLIPNDVRKCVTFLAYRLADGQFRLAGTAWYTGKPIANSDRATAFLVTAKHVIDAIRRYGLTEVFVRLNLSKGSTLVRTGIDDWVTHPTDPTVDVAVLRAGVPEEADHLVYPVTRFASHEVVREQSIGIGEEVFLTGLFVNHFGQSRNIPIVRVGNIAAMPEEAVATRLGPMEAYLVEARSIGGLSGSPVFVHLGIARSIDGQVKFAQGGPIFFLLGLMHGHWDVTELDVDDAMLDEPSRRNINMGIGIVVPAWKISDVLDQPHLGG